MDHQTCLSELKNFLDGEGRLISYPSKHRLKMIALFYLASQFSPGARYTEKEVNQILKSWHTFGDWAMLRRDLYDKRFFGREPDGVYYWLEEPQPALSYFGLKNA